MPKIKDLPKHKRPRERLLAEGPENLKDSELLAILLRTGREGKSAIDISKSILRTYPLDTLFSVSIEDLTSVKGIGTDKAVTLIAAFEFSKRATKSFAKNLPIIDSPQKAVDQLTHIRNKKKEHFVALYLNARNQLVHLETISIGTLTTSLVHPREVFAPALTNHAAGIILAHNHPSDNFDPSKEDILLTENLVRSGRILNIAVHDHIIITATNYFSFKQKGMIYEQE